MAEVKQSVPMCDRCSNPAEIECAKCGAPEDPVQLCLACSAIMHMGNGRLSRHNFIELATKKYQEALKVSYEYSSRDVGILKSKMKQFTMASEQATNRSKEFGRHIKRAYEHLQGLLKQKCMQFFNEVDADNAQRLLDIQKCTEYCNKLVNDSLSIKKELSSLERDSSDQMTVHLAKLEDKIKGLDVSHIGTLYPCLDAVYSIDFDLIEKSINSLTFTIHDPPVAIDQDEESTIKVENSGNIWNPLEEDSVFEVSVQSVITKTGEFWVDHQGNHDVHDKLYSLSQLIRREYITDAKWHTADLHQLQRGDRCYSFHTSDNMWCRTQVEEILIKQKKVSVRYLDYGNTEMMDTARILPHRELSGRQLPYQAILCCLFLDGLEMSREVQWSFNDLVKCETLKCRFLKKIPGSQSENAWYVELILNKESGETNMEAHMRELINKGNRQKAAISCRDIRLLDSTDVMSISTNVSTKVRKERASDNALPSSSTHGSGLVESPGKADDKPTDLTDQVLSVLRASSLASVDSGTSREQATHQNAKGSSPTKVKKEDQGTKKEKVITILKRPPAEANISDEKMDVSVVGADERAANGLTERVTKRSSVIVEPGESITLSQSDEKLTQDIQHIQPASDVQDIRHIQPASDVEHSTVESGMEQGDISLEDISGIASLFVSNYINAECNTKEEEEENESLKRADEQVEQDKIKSLYEEDVTESVLCDPTEIEDIDTRKDSLLREVDNNSQTEEAVASSDGTVNVVERFVDTTDSETEPDVRRPCEDEPDVKTNAETATLMPNATHVEAKDRVSKANALEAFSAAVSGDDIMHADIEMNDEAAAIEIKNETEINAAASHTQDDGDIKRNAGDAEQGTQADDETPGFAAEDRMQSNAVESEESTEVAMFPDQAIGVDDSKAESIEADENYITMCESAAANTEAGEDYGKLHESAEVHVDEDGMDQSEGRTIEKSESDFIDTAPYGNEAVLQGKIYTGDQMTAPDNSGVAGINNNEYAVLAMGDANQVHEDETQIKIANIAKQVVMSIIGQAVQEVNRRAENGIDTRNGCSSEMPMYHYAGIDDVTVEKIDRDHPDLGNLPKAAVYGHVHNTESDDTTFQNGTISLENVDNVRSETIVKNDSSTRLSDTEIKPQNRENIQMEHSYSVSRNDATEQCSLADVQDNSTSEASVDQQLTRRGEIKEAEECKHTDFHSDSQQNEGGQFFPVSRVEGRIMHAGSRNVEGVNGSARVKVVKRTKVIQQDAPFVERKMEQPPPMPVPAVHQPIPERQMRSPQSQMVSPQHQMGTPQQQIRSPHHHQSQMNPSQYIMPQVEPPPYQNTLVTRVVDSQPCFTSAYMNYTPYPGLNVSSMPFVPSSQNANIAMATNPERPQTRPGRVSPTSQLINTHPYKNIPYIPGIPDLPFNVMIDDNLSESGQFDALLYRRPEAEIEFLKMMEELRFCANKIMGWPLFIKDNIVAAPYNNLLFRAKMVEEHADNKVTILYVDYGNYAVLDIHHLKAIPPHLAQIPEQAGRFRISKPGHAPFTDHECVAFKNVTQDNICIAGQVAVKTSNVIDVRLFVSNKNGIYDVMELISSLTLQRHPGVQLPHAHVVETTSQPPQGQHYVEARSQSRHVHASTGDNRSQNVQGHPSAGSVRQNTGETRIQSPVNNNDRSGPDINPTCAKCGLAGHSVWQCLARDRSGDMTIAAAQGPECSQEVNTSFDPGAWQEEPQHQSNRSYNSSRHKQQHGKPWGHRDAMRTSPQDVYVPPPAREHVVSPNNSGNDQRAVPGHPRIPTPDSHVPVTVSGDAVAVTCSSPHNSTTSSHSGVDPTFVGFEENIWVEEGDAQKCPSPKKSARNLIASHIRGSQAGGDMMCFLCYSKTHLKKDCPEIPLQRQNSRHGRNKPKGDRRTQRD